MFVDLVNSTGLASSLDPEEMSELLRAYQSAVGAAIERFEGHVAKYMGDGVLAYFGYPRAHEDEGERAIRAGLAAVDAVCGLPSKHGPLQIRVGVATGPVVVGELIGEGAAREQTIVGETPNLAARLQSLAKPGTVAIDPRTRRLVGDLFDLIELGPAHLKGISVPVQASRIVGEGSAESRFEALHRTGVTPLVGREHELGLLLERWDRIKEGEGQVVLLAGEPGIGKSRLLRALRGRLEHEPHTNLSHYCSSHHQATALYPVTRLLERSAGFLSRDPPGGKLEKLGALLALSKADTSEAERLLAPLLSIGSNARDPPLDMSPHRQKERTLEVLVEQLLGLTDRHPVLALYEDVHWADPTTLELLDLVVDRVRDCPVLVLITFRTGFTPPWTHYAHVSSLTLSRLSRRQAAAMVGRLTDGKSLPAPVLDEIMAKTDGVPLFVEELTRAVLEANLLADKGDHYALTGPLPPMAIPATLEGSLLARLDRLAPAREVAQVAAAIGREFSYELLAAAAPLPQEELLAALEHLVESGLVFRRGVPPHANYSFKHALVQDAAYATLVRAKRQRLHATIAAAIEQKFPETAQTQPELLAYHHTEAGQAEAAIRYWLRAGQAEIARSATAEAITHLTKGLELVAGLPEGVPQWQQELELQIALGVALMAAKGWAAPEVGRANARARELCDRLGDTPRLFPVLYGEWVFHVVRAELQAGSASGEELLRRAEERGDRAAATVGTRIVGTAAFLKGEMDMARGCLEKSLSLYDPQRDSSLAFLFAQDPRVAALSVLSWALFALGYPEQAQARSNEALTTARHLAHGNTLGYALLYGCILSQMRRERPEARERADALIHLATEQGAPHFLGAGIVIRGWTLAESDGLETAISQMRDGLALWQSTGAGFLGPFFLSLLAEAEARRGSADAGLAIVSEALRCVAETGERWFEAELHRLSGELALQRPLPDPVAAETEFREAAAIAKQQSAGLWELRAATCLARILTTQHRNEEARTLLTGLCARFTEGFGTVDLQAAYNLAHHASRNANIMTVGGKPISPEIQT
jgi:predicted ATPase/class 3 adenylate cyclase